MWLEDRRGYDFGRQPDLLVPYIRNRLGLEVQPVSWLKAGGMMQDTRSPHYERSRPGGSQDPFDLHEAYVEIFPGAKTGWNFVAGRKRFQFGDQHVIGVPEWGNSGRTYDTGQINYRWKDQALHVLMASVVNFNPSGFNKPNLHDRLTGAYYEKTGRIDLYFFRHNRINLPATHTAGARVQHHFSPAWKTTVETMVQNAFGIIANLTWHLPGLDSIAEYKFASPGFDQLYPANHNRLGHTDLFFFRNVQSGQWRNVVPFGKHTKVNFMYTANWLVDSTQPAYNFSGGVIASSPSGAAGSFLGQEAAIYTTHQFGKFQLGLCVAEWFTGEFLKNTTPGKNSTYLYLHAGYLF